MKVYLFISLLLFGFTNIKESSSLSKNQAKEVNINDQKNYLQQLNDKTSKGTIDSGSNKLVLKNAINVKKGDIIIVETGNEYGKGLRGTVGVGGAWPYKNYSTEQQLLADKGGPAGLYAFANNTGDVWRWDGKGNWEKFTNRHYYAQKAIPFSLRTKVVDISSDGKIITLQDKAFAKAVNANVYFDNSVVFNEWFAKEQNAELPAGKFAIGDDIRINKKEAIKVKGQGLKTIIFSPNGSPSASFKIYNSPGSVIENFQLMGNGRSNGFALDLNIYPTTQFWENPYTESGGIQFFNTANSIAKGIKVTDALTYALQAGSCTNTTFENCQVVSTEGTFGYIGWNLHTYLSNNTVFKNCTFASPLLNNAMEDFGGKGTKFINCKIINGTNALNKSANAQFINCTVTIGADVMPQWMNFGGAVFDINMQYTGNADAYQSSTVIKDLTIIQKGYQKGNSAIHGIYARDFTPNIKVKNYYYERPNFKEGGNAAMGLFIWANGAEVDGAVIKGSFPADVVPSTYGSHISVTFAAVTGQGKGKGFIKNSTAELMYAIEGIENLNNTYKQFIYRKP